MNEDKPKRKRIVKSITATIIDPNKYTVSAASMNAQHKKSFTVHLNLDYFVDGHYVKRLTKGDENGAREGIEPKYVEPLVENSFLHLLHYSLRNKNVNVINYTPLKSTAVRVLLMETFKDQLQLNLIVEYHFIDVATYEATVITAMRKDGFQEAEGQYSINMNEKDSTLSVKVSGRRTEVDNYQV
ncbi:hypothetical protein IRZ71_16300 [Flavobacterium sp. ANB]|uniref:hypothetical protein n=1 Tax=unclassified Flavobacterium TaxID=196869 RepID=UPI0012B9E282|nr:MULTISPECIES: hypothetical protein [unclassified Flavobacterium]MBF4517929.1 hypothetical protein [Flavobacterium sp. ANB]MTD71327.1 hypothetical protein [Flavobacterium sp. LC2016-13]